jgi:DUF1680 family protein
VVADIGEVALKRGPVVYCLEGADNDRPLHRAALPKASPIEASFESGVLSGVVVLSADALAITPWPEGELYRTDPPATEPIRLRAVPYSFWSNRESEDMSVWIREV